MGSLETLEGRLLPSSAGSPLIRRNLHPAQVLRTEVLAPSTPTSHVIRLSGRLPGLSTTRAVLHFRLFASQTGGAPVFEETQRASLFDGRFSVLLGASTAGGLPTDLFRDHDSLYAGVSTDARPTGNSAPASRWSPPRILTGFHRTTGPQGRPVPGQGLTGPTAARSSGIDGTARRHRPQGHRGHRVTGPRGATGPQGQPDRRATPGHRATGPQGPPGRKGKPGHGGHRATRAEPDPGHTVTRGPPGPKGQSDRKGDRATPGHRDHKGRTG